MKFQCFPFVFGKILLAHIFALGLAFSYLARAETITITGTQIINQASVTVSDDLEYEIQNGSLLLFSNTFSQGATGAAFNVASGKTLTIGPAQAGGDGWTIFENYKNNSTAGAVIYAAGAATRIELTNVIFRNNYVAGATRGGAALQVVNTPLILNNVFFEGNNAGYGGAIRNRVGASGLTMTGGAFTGNYAWGNGYGGAIANESASISSFAGVKFEDNRSLAYGGAIAVTAGAVSFTNATFTNNWTGSFGGALFVATTATLGFSQSGSVKYYDYTGNFAGGDAAPALEELSSGTANFAAKSKGGGFLYMSAAAAKATFNMDSGVTLSIGSATAANTAHDSIASASGVTGANIFKEGAGDLVLHADNSYYASNVTVNAGRLMLGTQDAALGGKITVNVGATLGGSGTFMTLSQADIELPSTVTAKNGSFIQVGNGGPTDRLVFGGSTTLSAEAGVTFNYTLHENNKVTLLQAGNFQIAGSGTINLLSLEQGTFTLATWTTSNLLASNLSLVVNGAQGSARVNGNLSIQGGNTLQLQIDSILNSSDLVWTGSGGSIWAAGSTQLNWLGTTTGGTVQDFQKGDSVVTFDDSADLGGQSGHTIEVGDAGVSVQKMTVDGTSSYEFSGGAIAVTGTLIKTGSASLTLNNNASNTFNTIQFRDGSLLVSNTAQLGAALGKIDGDTFGADNEARVIFTGDAILDSAGSAAHRIALSDTTAGLGARMAAITAVNNTTLMINNASSSNDGGAIRVGAGNRFEITAGGTGAVVFNANASTGAGGAIANTGASAKTNLVNVVFTANTAASGGALYNTGTINYNITRTGTTINADNTATAADKSGFIKQAAAGATLNINVSAGASLVIGGADTSNDGMAGVAGSKINKSGAGDWMLKSDSSNFLGDTMVSQGSFLLGGTGAKYGGAISVNSAVIGGAGEFTGSVTINSGTLRMGLPGATSGQSLGIASLSLANSVIDFGIFNGSNDLLNIGTLTSLDAFTKINIDDFIIGDYIIATGAVGGITQFAALGATLDGTTLGGGRQQLRLEASGTSLLLHIESGTSCIAVWTGTGVNPAVWEMTNKNWRDTTDGSFANMDKVIFADDPAGTAHTIDIPSNVQISDMIVSGTEDYTFTGPGGITAKANGQYGTAFTGTGKLVKGGAGVLTFENLGANIFRGGIDISGGVIAFRSGAQLGTNAASITFKDNATLRATADSLTLASNIIIETDKFATIDTGIYTLTYSGTSSGASGTIIKTGAGSLIYNGNGALGHAATRIEDGVLKLSGVTDHGIAHRFELDGGWVDLSDANPSADPVNEWANFVFSGTRGGVIGGNDCITLGAGDRLFDLGHPSDSGKQGIYVILDAGAGGVATMTGANNYLGATRLKSGTLRISDDAQLGLVSANREIIFEGGKLDITSAAFTTDRAVDVREAGGGASVAASATATFNGAFTGTTGAFAKDGAGTLVLAGDNSNYAGGFDLNAGALELEHAKSLGSGRVNIGGDNTKINIKITGASIANAINTGSRSFVIDAGGNNTTFAGAIQGGGILTLQGGGRHVFSGDNRLDDLNLRANTTLAANSVTALGGRDSNVTMDAGSKIEITKIGTLANNMKVTDATLQFSNINGLAHGQAMLRTFGTLTLENSSTIALVGAVGARAYTLVQGTIKLADGATLVFDKGAANANIEVFHAIGEQNQNFLIAGLDMSTNPGKDITVSFDAIIASMDAVHSRLSETFLMPFAEHSQDSVKGSFWLKAIGTFGDFAGDNERIGFSDNTYGGIFGYDGIIGKKLLVGMFGGYSISTIKTVNDAETQSQLPYAGVYAAIRMKPMYISLDLLGGEVDGRTTRQEPNNRVYGTYRGFLFGGSVEAGTVLNIWEGAMVKPSAALAYMQYKYQDQEEVGEGAIIVDDFSKDTLQGVVSLTFTQCFYTLPQKLPGALDIKIGWRKALQDDVIDTAAGLASTPGTKFRIMGDKYDCTGYTLGIGLRFALTRKATLGAAYDCTLNPDYARHTASTSLRWTW